MPSTHIGKFPVKQPDRLVYSRSAGNSVTQEWICPKAFAYGLVAQLRPLYDTVEMEDDGIIARVRATTRAPQYGEVETPVITYELQQSEQVVDLKFHEDYAMLTASENGLIDKAIDDKLTYDEWTTEYLTAAARSNSDVSSDHKTIAEALLYRKRRGQDSFLVYGWLFTRNLSVSIYYPTQIVFTNHGLRWSNEQLNRYCNGIPNFVLPSLTASADQTTANLAYAWLQTQSSVQISNKGGFNLTEGWTQALWDTTVYGASTY